MSKHATTNPKRTSLKLLLGSGVLLSETWRTPLINAVILPAHAQTSMCSGYDIEPVSQPITITVTDTEVRGPFIAPIATRTGQTFSASQNSVIDQCQDLSGTTQDLEQQIEFSGIIDSANNQIIGSLNINQYCGDTLVCEQLTQFTATQQPIVSNNDLGDYQGTLTGTLRCCRDF